MSSSLIGSDSSWLSRADRWLFRLERWLTLLAGVLVLVIVVGSMINIIGRGLFNRPFLAYFDIMAQAVPLIAFLGLSYCARLGGHVRLDLLLAKLKGRWLWAVESLMALLLLVISVALCYGSWLHTLRALRIGDSTEDAGLPIWPIKLVVFSMFVLLSVRFGLQLACYVRAFMTNQAVGVPLILSVEQQVKQIH